ncbi:hypothetical protein A2617_02680 [Candidatus Daviesbacteria bacterium RIFOXYD1_FULL_41_10]|uniref:Glucose/Sorbosone dehydrogenase domain-containing protein n=2 Tax=Candidatus Daviesiibacteriota TaxID=1752718 RepID=A0A1F5N1J7_9BACT|nr:MAG: Quinoprotein glucose dehydrogenase [Candidatus Daviesbacteria bacterium GW2011_GWB1_41_5]OGE71506.1 MAG: hypothetical protein A2617_02680 [Candidatus Daviesbacteria bacterium RIFOXYD1_FULL_41_10]
MKSGVIIIGVLLLILAAGGFILTRNTNRQSFAPKSVSGEKSPEISGPQVVVQNLDTPWGIAFLPSGEMLVTERLGRVRLGEKLVATLSQVKEISEGGLLGIAIDPDFSNNNFVYLYYTFSGDVSSTLNRVSRFIFKDSKLDGEEIVVDNIPGAPNHNGGRLKFGPDKLLYITTGDAQNPSLSQDKNSLAGKILRVKGGNVEVVSFGHRNPQGLAWDNTGRLWETEHGPSAHDEVNLIEQDKNYGWPDITGNETRAGMISPVIQSGDNTWAPSGVAFFEGRIFFGGLRGTALFEFNPVDNSLKEHFKGQFGRIRDVILGPDNMLYISTSNQDGRGNPFAGDDKIIKINPQKL